MTQTQVQLSNVIYNAGSQCFEALVTVTTRSATKTYSCAIEAPITMSFEQAAEGLKIQALRQNAHGTGMYSQMRHHVAPALAGRTNFDPRTWLAQLGLGYVIKAA